MWNSNPLIDQILDDYKDQLLHDYTKYRNHAYRVYHACTLLDPQPQNSTKYAIAASFHDLGIWTKKTFDYLDPSISLAKDWLVKHNSEKWSDEISLMISMHHKVTRYTGTFAETVEIFRKADWIDVSLGLMKFGTDGKKLNQIQKLFPTKGFHRFLIRKTLRNLLHHPLKPLPMFKF
ncbi:MAG: phosphohydrolase [Cyclobacteriaceae bacterium]|nr:phosphohydrolase [Cyclobacteriaceae bacterium]